jgi:hypothetical protein
MEHTEWNVKCWGPTFKEDVQLKNGGFEDGLADWSVTPGANASPDRSVARRGVNGLKVVVRKGDPQCEISQTFDRPQNARTFTAGVWVRTDNPSAVKLELRQANDGAHKDELLGEWGSRLTRTWERVMASAKMLDETKQVKLVIRIDGPATACIDEAKLYYTPDERGQCPISATTFEQELFCVDAFREMALGGCPRAHLHHLAGDYPCGAMTGAGETKNLGKVFEFFNGAYGDKVVGCDVKTESFGYYTGGKAWATDFNALAPDRADIPMLGAMASKSAKTLYLLLINRSSDRDISVKIDLGLDPADPKAGMRTLSGTDIDLPGATLSEGTIKVSRKFTHTIGPYTAEIISIRTR